MSSKITTSDTRNILNSTFTTLFTIALLIIFLAPFVFMVFTSMKDAAQVSTVGSPIWPAEFPKYEYNGQNLDVFKVPLPDGTKGIGAPKERPEGKHLRRSAGSIGN